MPTIDPLASLRAELERVRERLAAAEAVCLMYGWSPSRARGTDSEKATFELWMRWRDIVPPGFCDPDLHPALSDSGIAELARRRDEALTRVNEALCQEQGEAADV